MYYIYTYIYIYIYFYIYIYIYMLLRRSVETFSFRDFSNTRDIRRYCFKYLQVDILIYLY